MPYKKILLKISGEVLGHPLKTDVLDYLVQDCSLFQEHGGELAIVVGGGNFWRGAQEAIIDRAVSDQMGMLATCMNGLALHNYFEQKGLRSCLMTSQPIPGAGQLFHAEQAHHTLGQGKILILAGGTGNPFFTTDTAAVLRALELQCSLVAKATKVKGIYSADPLKDSSATFYPTLTYQEALSQKLEIMDQTAFALAQEHHLPIAVFSLLESGLGCLQIKGNQQEFTLVS